MKVFIVNWQDFNEGPATEFVGSKAAALKLAKKRKKGACLPIIVNKLTCPNDKKSFIQALNAATPCYFLSDTPYPGTIERIAEIQVDNTDED